MSLDIHRKSKIIKLRLQIVRTFRFVDNLEVTLTFLSEVH